MKTVYAFLAIVVLSLVSGCTTDSSREATSNPGTDISRYHTFALNSLPKASPASDPGATLRLGDTARQEVVHSLTEKGFLESSADQADFLVDLVGDFRPDPLSISSERRTLTINFVDRNTGNEIWSASRGRSATRTSGPEELRSTIAAMLAPVPRAANLQGK